MSSSQVKWHEIAEMIFSYIAAAVCWETPLIFLDIPVFERESAECGTRLICPDSDFPFTPAVSGATFRLLRWKFSIYSVHASQPRFSSRFETDAVEQPRQIAGKLSVPSTIALTFDANIPSLRLPFSKPFVFTMFTFKIRLKASTFPDDRLFAIVCEIPTNKRFVSLNVLGWLTIF